LAWCVLSERLLIKTSLSESLPRYGPFKAFVGNLHFETEQDDLREFFESKGCEVIEATVVRDPMTNVVKGFGYIEVANRMHLKLALEASGDVRNRH
jgi:translation initiation factor 4B